MMCSAGQPKYFMEMRQPTDAFRQNQYDLFATGAGRLLLKTIYPWCPMSMEWTLVCWPISMRLRKEGIKEGTILVVNRSWYWKMERKCIIRHSERIPGPVPCNRLSASAFIPGATLPVSPTDVYDLASLADKDYGNNTFAVMKLIRLWRLNLTGPCPDYLPWLQDTDKKDVLSGNYWVAESGLPSTLLFPSGSYRWVIGTLFKGKARCRSATDRCTYLGKLKFKFQKGWHPIARQSIHWWFPDSLGWTLLVGRHIGKDYRNLLARPAL